MSERTAKIYEALTTLCEACTLQGESGTETLFLALSPAFDDANVDELEGLRRDSHEEGLMYNMLWPMSEKIEKALDALSDDHRIPPWQI